MSEEKSNKNKQPNFFKTFLKSIKDLDKYEDFALELPRDAFKYLFKLVLIFAIIITIFFSYKVVDSVKEIYGNLKEKLPEFSYSQGILTVNTKEPIVLEEYKETFGKVIIDTRSNINKEKYAEDIKSNSALLLILKDSIIITSNNTTGQVEYSYLDIANKYNITEFNKKDVVNYVEKINVISLYGSVYFVLFIYLFIIYFIAILIDVLILSFLAYVIARISRMQIKYAPAFNIAVHSITLPALLNLIYIIVNLLTGFNIKYFQWMYNTISYIYVVVAILMIKTDFINRQIELIKIAEEQERIKEELKKKKEEDEKRKEEEKQEKEEKQKEKKKKNKKQNDGELEEGVNPSVIEEKQ